MNRELDKRWIVPFSTACIEALGRVPISLSPTNNRQALLFWHSGGGGSDMRDGARFVFLPRHNMADHWPVIHPYKGTPRPPLKTEKLHCHLENSFRKFVHFMVYLNAPVC